MVTDLLRQKRLEELIVPVETKGQLYQKFSYVSKKDVKLLINKCITENRGISIDQAKKLSIIWPKEYEMFLERMKGIM